MGRCDAWHHKWCILFLSGLILFNNYYAYDLASALSEPIAIAFALPPASYLFNLLYSIYALPNIILPAVGGILLEHKGRRCVMTWTATFVFLGQVVFTLGILLQQPAILVAGRLFLGLGGEVAAVATSAVVRDRDGRFLPLSLASQLCIGRLGSAANSLVTPLMARRAGLSAASALSVALCATSLLACYLIGWHFGVRPLQREAHPVQVAVAPFEWRALWRSTAKLHFPAPFWLLCVICFTLYGSIIPFQAIAPEYMEHTFFPGQFVRAAAAMSIPDILSAVLIIPFGFALALPSLLSWALCGACLMLLSSHAILLSSLPGQPFVALNIMGVGYALFGTALWPSIARMTPVRPAVPQDMALRHITVDCPSPSIEELTPQKALSVHTQKPIEEEEDVGPAIGMAQSIQNLGLTIIPLIVSRIIETDGYRTMELFFIGLATIGLCVSGLYIYVSRPLRSRFTKPLSPLSGQFSEESILLSAVPRSVH